MNILLLSMPDSFEHMPSVAIRMPNGALASLAGNVDPHHRVAIADLILVQRRVRETLERLVREVQPDVIGLSIMTSSGTPRSESSSWSVACGRPRAWWSAGTTRAWPRRPTRIRTPEWISSCAAKAS